MFSLAAGTIANLPESVIAGRGTRRRRPLPLTAAAGILALGLMGMLFTWHFAPADGARGAKEIKVERPTVAVLPFANISGDKDEDYFIDGLTEDLVTELARGPAPHGQVPQCNGHLQGQIDRHSSGRQRSRGALHG